MAEQIGRWRTLIGSWSRGRKLAVGSAVAFVLVLAVSAPVWGDFLDLLRAKGLATSPTSIVVVDDGGADDEPGQKDLNFLIVDYGAVPELNPLDVAWGWDDTAWDGGNTGDACVLFDTDDDGNANYSLCVVVEGEPAAFKSWTLYSCGDDKADRCSQKVEEVTISGDTACEAAVYGDVDPFGIGTSEHYSSAHVTGNPCRLTPGCYTDDMVAQCTIDLDDFGGQEATLINVCSYPSGPPNNDPSDCVFAPNSGFLTIVKVADPDEGTPFPFTSSAGSRSGDTQWTINGSGSEQLISFAPGTYTLSETVPAGWQLVAASCSINGDSVGTFDGSNAVQDLVMESGLETTCTFTDTRSTGSLEIAKTVSGGPDGYAGSFDVLVTCDGDGGVYSPTISYPTPGYVTISGIPTGNTCTVTEPVLPTAPMGYSWGDAVIGEPVVISKDATAEVTVANTLTRDTGSLEIAKSVTRDVPPGFSQTFTFTATCTDDSNSPYSLAIDYPSETEVIQDGIPTGAVCTVEEGVRADVPGYTWGDPVYTDNPATVVEKDGTYTVEVQNPISQNPGALQVDKTWSGPGDLVEDVVIHACPKEYAPQDPTPWPVATPSPLPEGWQRVFMPLVARDAYAPLIIHWQGEPVCIDGLKSGPWVLIEQIPSGARYAPVEQRLEVEVLPSTSCSDGNAASVVFENVRTQWILGWENKAIDPPGPAGDNREELAPEAEPSQLSDEELKAVTAFIEGGEQGELGNQSIAGGDWTIVAIIDSRTDEIVERLLVTPDYWTYWRSFTRQIPEYVLEDAGASGPSIQNGDFAQGELHWTLSATPCRGEVVSHDGAPALRLGPRSASVECYSSARQHLSPNYELYIAVVNDGDTVGDCVYLYDFFRGIHVAAQ